MESLQWAYDGSGYLTSVTRRRKPSGGSFSTVRVEEFTYATLGSDKVLQATAEKDAYAKMVAEDRRLKLTGYEVYRFGGQEFVAQTTAGTMLDDFFKKLLARCGYELKEK